MKKDSLLLILIAYLAFVMLGMWDGLIGVAWPSLRDTFSQANDALGIVVLFTAAGHMAASFLNGTLISRRGVAFLLILSSGLAAAGQFLQSVAPQWPIFVAVGLILGVSMGMMDSGMNTYAATYFRPRLLNWLHAAFALGTTLGSALMTAVLLLDYDGDNWRIGIRVVAALHAVMVIIFLLTRRRWSIEAAEGTSNAEQPSTPSATNRETLRLWRFWIAAAVFFMYTGIEVGVGSWGFTLMTEGRDIAPQTAGAWNTAYWGSFLAGRIILGFVETNLNRLARLAATGMAVGIAIFAFAPLPIFNLLGLVVTGFALAPMFPAWVALTPERLGKRHAANAIGYQIGAAGVGAAVLPGLIGIVAEQFGLGSIGVALLLLSLLLFALHELLIRSGNHIA